ncbi:hypothetical protein WA158_005466 [Blastocystis sp. Blastoise]
MNTIGTKLIQQKHPIEVAYELAASFFPDPMHRYFSNDLYNALNENSFILNSATIYEEQGKQLIDLKGELTINVNTSDFPIETDLYFLPGRYPATPIIKVTHSCFNSGYCRDNPDLFSNPNGILKASLYDGLPGDYYISRVLHTIQSILEEHIRNCLRSFPIPYTPRDDNIPDEINVKFIYFNSIRDISTTTRTGASADFSFGYWKGHMVGIKEYKALSPSNLINYYREIHLQSECNHPNIATLYGITTMPSGKNGLVVEYGDNGTLDQYLQQYGSTLSEEIRKQMCLQLIGAVEYMHSLNIMHRDIKPANIIMVGSTPKFIDFGLARALFKDQRAKTLCGSHGYIAPEVLSNSGSYDKPADIFSLASVLYILIAGKSYIPIPNDKNDQRWLMDYVHGIYHAEFKRGLHSCLQSLFTACFSPNPLQRPSLNTIRTTILNTPFKEATF